MTPSFINETRNFFETELAFWKAQATELSEKNVAQAESFVKEARERLQTAADAYAGILSGVGRGLLAERATFGLAKANESLGNLDDARQGYEVVAQDYPNGAVAGMARQRAEALKGETVKEWYTWFENRKPTPPPVDNSPILGLPSEDPPTAPAGSDALPATEPAIEAAPATPPAAQE